MKRNGALQIIFAFFLGLVVVGFVGIGVSTFYPEPSGSSYDNQALATWRLVTGIILLAVATLILAISLTLPPAQEVISNGVLLGGVFTMIYAVGVTVSSDQSIWRFVVVAIALVITVAIGYLRFSSRAPRASAPVEISSDPALAARLTAMEQRFEALRRALQD
jgi:hypothetical protein